MLSLVVKVCFQAELYGDCGHHWYASANVCLSVCKLQFWLDRSLPAYASRGVLRRILHICCGGTFFPLYVSHFNDISMPSDTRCILDQRIPCALANALGQSAPPLSFALKDIINLLEGPTSCFWKQEVNDRDKSSI